MPDAYAAVVRILGDAVLGVALAALYWGIVILVVSAVVVLAVLAGSVGLSPP